MCVEVLVQQVQNDVRELYRVVVDAGVVVVDGTELGAILVERLFCACAPCKRRAGGGVGWTLRGARGRECNLEGVRDSG